jgi:hypothetical protein
VRVTLDLLERYSEEIQAGAIVTAEWDKVRIRGSSATTGQNEPNG